MDSKQINKIIMDLTIIVDTREKENKHIIEYFEKNNIPYICRKLDSADYSFVLPNHLHLCLDNKILVERKGSIDELAGNLSQNRDRFEREFERIRKDQRIHLVLENFTYKKMLNGTYRSGFNPMSYLGSLMTWCIRYKCPIWTVTKAESPVIIYNIMKYELREILKEL